MDLPQAVQPAERDLDRAPARRQLAGIIDLPQAVQPAEGQPEAAASGRENHVLTLPKQGLRLQELLLATKMEPHSNATAPAPLSPASTGVFLRRPLVHSFSGRVSCIQCSNCWLPSSHAAKIAWMLACCLQSPFWPGSTGVQCVLPGIIRSSNSHFVTKASLILLEACKYPEMCAVPPCSGMLYE